MLTGVGSLRRQIGFEAWSTSKLTLGTGTLLFVLCRIYCYRCRKLVELVVVLLRCIFSINKEAVLSGLGELWKERLLKMRK